MRRIKGFFAILLLAGTLLSVGCQKSQIADVYDVPEGLAQVRESPLLPEIEYKTISSFVSILSEVDFDAVHTAILEAENLPRLGEGSVSEELFKLWDAYGKGTAFCAVDLYEGVVAGYGLDVECFAASMIKCPYVLWVCMQIDAGKGSLEEEVEYLRRDRLGGTGLIRTFDRKVYTVRELIHYILLVSDNDAYSMLYHRFGIDGYNEWLASVDVDTLRLYDGLWSECTPRDMALVWLEVCRYGASAAFCSNFLLWEFAKAEENYIGEAIGDLNGSECLIKNGWTNGYFHETGAVLEKDHPLLVGVYTAGNKKENDITFIRQEARELYLYLREARKMKNS